MYYDQERLSLFYQAHNVQRPDFLARHPKAHCHLAHFIFYTYLSLTTYINLYHLFRQSKEPSSKSVAFTSQCSLHAVPFYALFYTSWKQPTFPDHFWIFWNFSYHFCIFWNILPLYALIMALVIYMSALYNQHLIHNVWIL